MASPRSLSGKTSCELTDAVRAPAWPARSCPGERFGRGAKPPSEGPGDWGEHVPADGLRRMWSRSILRLWRRRQPSAPDRRTEARHSVNTTPDDTPFTVIRGGEVYAPEALGQREILISG